MFRKPEWIQSDDTCCYKYQDTTVFKICPNDRTLYLKSRDWICCIQLARGGRPVYICRAFKEVMLCLDYQTFQLAAGYLINKQQKLWVSDSVLCLVQDGLSGLVKHLPSIIINPHLESLLTRRKHKPDLIYFQIC